uniref:CSON002304 protein n=1 Tax=Culicoides sonorensis TaxID=179676 RepID=A0A336L0B5_CULSO
MLPETLLFIISMAITGSLLFLLVYFVIILSDLECDYINAQTCCAKLNFWVIPKLGAHAFLAFLLLIHQNWGLFLLNIPGVAWMLYEKLKIPSGNIGVYDPAEIHNRGMIRKHLRDCMIYLGFYLLIFFVYLYYMIIALLKGDPIKRHEEGEIISEF